MLKGSCSTTSLHDFLYLTSFTIVSLNPQPPEQTFQDVVGVDEAKSELLEIVDFLRNPEKFTRLGGKMTKGTAPLFSGGGGGEGVCVRERERETERERGSEWLRVRYRVCGTERMRERSKSRVGHPSDHQWKMTVGI